MKDYFYIGVSLVFLAIFLRISFWALYTTEARDIFYDEETLSYQDFDPDDDVRIHGTIDSLEYYESLDPDIPLRESVENGTLNLTSSIFLHTLQVTDNLTVEDELIHNMTLRNLLIYDGEFSDSILENITFENVSFIKSSFTKVVFQHVVFANVSFIDCHIKESLFQWVQFNTGYSRELEMSESQLIYTTLVKMTYSRTNLNHMEMYECDFFEARFNDSEISGVRFDNNTWRDCTYYNTSFDVIIFNNLALLDCGFLESTFQNILTNYTASFDHTFIRLYDVDIRINRDITQSYNEDTSIYGKFQLKAEEGTIQAERGENITYSYQIFQEKELHHSLRIDGVFYVIIVGGFTIITYAYGGKAILMALIKFFLPFIISGIGVLVLFLTLPWDTFEKLGTWMVLYFFPPLGKESVIPAAIAQGISPLMIAMAVAFIDIMIGLFLLWNFDLARKIPLLGSFINRIESKGKDILTKKPWVERLAFTGIVLFVMFPFQGSGAVGATIVGRMLGMDPKKVWYGVIIGAIVGTLIIAYTSAFAITFLLGIGLAYAVLTIILVVIFIALFYNYDKWGDWVKERF